MAITSDHALASEPEPGPDPEEAVGLLLRDLRASPEGLSTAEAQRRLLQYGPNELRRRRGMRWPAELAAQLTHPLALLLWAAAALSFAVGNGVIAIAVLLVIFLNAAFALAQELQAERAVEALSRYLPQKATALRDSRPSSLGVILLAAVFVYAPRLQSLLGTAALPGRDVLFLLPYPLVVWGADELRRLLLRRRATGLYGRLPGLASG